MELAIILTARCGSARLPGKVVANVAGQPLLYWIARRLTGAGRVIIATTDQAQDDAIEAVAKLARVACYRYRGEPNDVVGRMEAARARFAPKADYVMRGLGDCPFMAPELIGRAVHVMHQLQGEAFQWATVPAVQPVYGAREFPYDREAWARVAKESEQREHVDLYYHNYRERFCTVYHEAPPNTYFRPYRLEVDWPEDLALVRKVADAVGMLAPLPDIIKYLDEHDEVAKLNHNRVEITGPLTSTDYKTQRTWLRLMQGQPIVAWDNQIWRAADSAAQPVFCITGKHLLGFAGDDGILHTRVAKIKEGYLECECGPKIWHAPIKHKYAEMSSASFVYA